MSPDEMAARIETLAAERDAAREDAGHHKAMRASCNDEMHRFVRKTIDLEAKLAAVQPVDVDRLTAVLLGAPVSEWFGLIVATTHCQWKDTNRLAPEFARDFATCIVNALSQATPE